MEKKITTPVVKGLVLALILIVFGIVLHLSGQGMNKGLGAISYIIMIGGVIWACINYANQMDNNVTFGNVFAHGFKTTAVITVLMVVYTVLAVKVLFPEMQDLALEQTSLELEKQNMSDDQAETALDMTRRFFIPFAIAGVLVMFMIMGLIASLIGAGVAKKNPQTPFPQHG